MGRRPPRPVESGATMLASIKHKLLAAVLLAVVLPFAGFGWFLERVIVDDLSWQFVRESLRGMARDLSEQVDGRLSNLVEDLELWAAEPLSSWALDERLSSGEAAAAGDDTTWGASQTLALAQAELDTAPGAELRRALTESFDRYVRTKARHQLLLLIGEDGRLVVSNSQDRLGQPLADERLADLFARDFQNEAWFQRALAGELVLLDHHVSPYLHPDGIAHLDPSADLYSVALATHVPDHVDPRRAAGVLFALVSWRTFQELIDAPIVKDIFRGLAADGEPSPYAWIWSRDGEAILAHADPRLYLTRLRDPPVGLPAMVEDVNALDATGKVVRGGLYRPYEFRGKAKNAAFHRSALPEALGFDWVVGVGIDDEDVERATAGLSRLLLNGTALVLVVVVLWVGLIARRTTRPLLALGDHTRRVAAGDLDARFESSSNDEVGALADAFNAMTRDLAQQRRELVKAEKDAAWREMARQVAHDIKGPLTPIRLSLDLLERTLADDAPRREEIVRRTLEMMRRQVDALRDIASDFYHFTGGANSRPTRFDLGAMVDEVTDLCRAWAEELHVRMERHGPGAEVYVDPGKLRRVLGNLVGNALQAMGEGGELSLEVREDPALARVELLVDDTGEGLSEEVRAHLFEPYFTTRSEGTGLGLAIAWRTLEDMGGGIELGPRPDGRRGTRARIWLPRPPPES